MLAAGSLQGQTAPAVPSVPAPIGLSRLKDKGKPGEAPPLASGKFAVDDLSPGPSAGASKVKKGNNDFLALSPGTEWSRPLRGSPKDVSFISFQLYPSAGTIVELGGVRLGFTSSPFDGALQLMFDDSANGTLQWKSLKLNLDTGTFDGKKLSMLPTLTVRLDPQVGVWDIFSGSRLLADNLPLIGAKKDDRRFLVRAGKEGVWISGLVMADENPLYEDANVNGIDDRFEREKRGALLSAQASIPERKLLAQQWKDAQRKKAPPPLHVSRPMPDGAVASSPPK